MVSGIEPTSPIPLYHQVSTVLRQRIADGTYRPGERIAREDDLAQEFEVSRATIRQAVGELVRTNLLLRQQGRGTFVSESARRELGHIVRGDLGDLVAAGSGDASVVGWIDLAHDVELSTTAAGLLELAEPRGTVLRRIRNLEGEPLAYSIDSLPDHMGRLLSGGRLDHEGVLQQLTDAGVQLGGGQQSIRAALADLEVSRALELPLGSAVLQVERVLWNRKQEPVEVFQSWYRADRYEYTVTYDQHGGVHTG